MTSYEQIKAKIIATLMGRPAGTEIQPDQQQDYTLNMLDYTRSLELIATSTLMGIAEATTTPLQPDSSKVCYIAGIGQNRTVTFQNFHNQNGTPISITTNDMQGVFVILLWNQEYWSYESFETNIISHADSANFYYSYNIKKTYSSISEMNADKNNPVGVDGKYIKIGDIVTVVNSTTPTENGIYSYQGVTDGWKFQSSFNFQVEQSRSQDPYTAPSSKLFDDTISAEHEAITALEQETQNFQESSDFLYIIKDSEGKIIIGLRKNGNVYYGYQIPNQIKQEIEFSIRKLYNTYITLLNNKVDKDGNKVLSDTNFSNEEKDIVDISNFQESSDFAKVITDNNGTIIKGITNKGEVYILKPKFPNNDLYLKTTKIKGWIWCLTNSKGGIIAGIRADGSCYISKGIPNDVNRVITNLNSSLKKYSDENLNTIFCDLPCIDYGRIVLSKFGDDYCHNPRIINHHHKMYCFYHSATGRTGENPSDNSDRISFLSFNLLNPHYKNYYERGIVADDLNPDLYNGNPVEHIYNITTFISPNDKVVLKYSGNVNGICYQFFKCIDNLNNLYTFNLKYELNGISKTVVFSNYNYYKMLNELYNYNYDLNSLSSHLAMDITDIVKYGNNYYQLVSYPYNYTELHPRVFLKSEDGITWESVGIVKNNIYGSDEISIEIKDDIVYCIDRNDSYQGEQPKEQNGQYFFTFDLNANLLTQPIRVSTSPAFPKVFKWHNEVFGIYNIPDDYCDDANRARAQLSKLNIDGTITTIKQYLDYYGFVYPCVIDYGYPVIVYAEMSYLPSTICLGVLKF